jgi:hypothetical protein
VDSVERDVAPAPQNKKGGCYRRMDLTNEKSE